MQRTGSVFRVLLPATMFICACSIANNSAEPKDASSSGGAGTLGGTSGGGGTSSGTGGTVSGGVTGPAAGGALAGTSSGGGTSSAGGIASGGVTGPAAGGTFAGSGGVASGGKTSSSSGTGPTLQQACTAICAAQTTSGCAATDCQTSCVNEADATVSAITKCKAQYTAMAQCEANLGADKWTCSTDANVPIPVDGLVRYAWIQGRVPGFPRARWRHAHQSRRR